MSAIHPNEAAAAVRDLIESYTKSQPPAKRLKVSPDNTSKIDKIKEIFSSCPKLVQDKKLMYDVYHFVVDRGGKTAEVGREWIVECLKRKEGDIAFFELNKFLQQEDLDKITTALRSSVNYFDANQGELVLSKENPVEAEKLWSFIEQHDVKSLVVEGKEIKGELLKRYADVKPSVQEMIDVMVLKWDSGEKMELPKATLLCCGDFFHPIIRGGFRERDTSEISMVSSYISREIFGAILERVETAKFPEVDYEEYLIACDFLEFELFTIPEGGFGPAEWGKHFGDVGEVPPLPPDLEVGDNQLLVLIPSTVDGKPYCLDLLGELVKHPKKGSATKYALYDKGIRLNHGQERPEGSYWVLMDMDVMEGSKYKSRAEQLAMASEKEGCRAPKLLEVATAVLMHHVATGERKLSDDPVTYTCCQEEVSGYKTVVGAFSSSGLTISYDRDRRSFVGVVSLQEV